MHLSIWITAAVALAVTLAAIPFLSILAVQWGLVDQPNPRKIHTRPTPLVGGLAVFLGVVVAMQFATGVDAQVRMVMAAAAFVLLLGLLDDRFDIPSRWRLLLQIIVAGVLSYSGVRLSLFPIEALNHLVTVIWIVAAVNAFNCLDCADAVAGAASVAIFGALAVIAQLNGRYFVATAAICGMGAALGFLWYNRPPARVFLGDTGSTFLGLMIATLAILAAPGRPAEVSFPWATLMLAIPVWDFALVHVRRHRAGLRSIRELLGSTGKDHLPHRLLARGMGSAGTAAAVTCLVALTAISAIAFDGAQWIGGSMALIVAAALLWHLDEDSSVEIRDEDQVAIYQPGSAHGRGHGTASNEAMQPARRVEAAPANVVAVAPEETLA